MTHLKPQHDFSGEVDCTYKEERYSVRDNGAILRHPRVGNRLRPTDGQWTFGKPNAKNGYMEIACVSVHRIVATAFHGVPPTEWHVVDHIDTNKRNNRCENLRWVTRLENVLLNPITARRIAIVCGSVEAFLADPAKFRDAFQESNFKWMRTVSAQDAQISYERLLAWAAIGQHPSGGSLDRWIFNRTTWLNQRVETIPEALEIKIAKPLNAAQRNWKLLSEFPCCPQEYTEDPITAYAEELKLGSVFCRNDNYSSLLSKSVLSEDRQTLYVIAESASKNVVKPWALAEITYENGLFVHTSLGTFFTQEGAEKQYSLAQGLEWTGGESIDDYC
ncbi:HNH endonuclease signature motif containing protein [Chitinophaga sp. MM2321]|uniref:HNH endonuclease signature motif containing protein n=1 Tax=Chitinophaga sp. MM2321 TaxID=3137178 RepID=UPI0032D574DB